MASKYFYPNVLLLITMFFLSSCGGNSAGNNKDKPVSELSPIPMLWERTVSVLLTGDLWLSQNNYDSAHVLMVPLHWAYELDDRRSYQLEFETYFSRFIQEGTLDQETNQLRKLQYLYLHSQYLKLKHDSSQDPSPTENMMFDQLDQELRYQWNERTVSTYGTNPSFKGMKDRLAFKLDQIATVPEYAKAIFDEELYLIAIAADLVFILGEQSPPYLLEIVAYGYRMFIQESIEIGDGWFFQLGIWSHHRDYRYAGNQFLETDLTEMIIEDIPTDSSHMHRMPLWLRSLQGAYEPQSPEYSDLSRMIEKLQWQFENVVLVPGDDEFSAPRLTNFFDGWNGVYRYNYDTVGTNLGYGPYGISGALPYSWYAFLYSYQLKAEFKKIQFPLADNILELYVGPNTTRQRHPLLEWPSYFNNGFAQLNMTLASELND